MLVGHHPSLENSFGIVDTAWEPLQLKEQLFGCGRAVETVSSQQGRCLTARAYSQWRSKALQTREMVAVYVAEEASQRGTSVSVRTEEID